MLGGKSVLEPCATSAAMPMLSHSLGCGGGLADVDRVGAHFNGQGDIANHAAGVRANYAAAQNLALAMSLRGVVKKQFGHTLVATVGNRSALSATGEQAF